MIETTRSPGTSPIGANRDYGCGKTTNSLDEIMVLDPTNYTTWTAFSDHPIFGIAKYRIVDWSLDPSCYCKPDSYGQFLPECYVHIDPAPPIHDQLQTAERDIRNLAAACAEIEREFGQIEYEMVILDDFTVYVSVRHPHFSIELYPTLVHEDAILNLFIDSPDVEASEHHCATIMDLIAALRQTVGT